MGRCDALFRLSKDETSLFVRLKATFLGTPIDVEFYMDFRDLTRYFDSLLGLAQRFVSRIKDLLGGVPGLRHRLQRDTGDAQIVSLSPRNGTCFGAGNRILGDVVEVLRMMKASATLAGSIADEMQRELDEQLSDTSFAELKAQMASNALQFDAEIKSELGALADEAEKANVPTIPSSTYMVAMEALDNITLDMMRNDSELNAAVEGQQELQNFTRRIAEEDANERWQQNLMYVMTDRYECDDLSCTGASDCISELRRSMNRRVSWALKKAGT